MSYEVAFTAQSKSLDLGGSLKMVYNIHEHTNMHILSIRIHDYWTSSNL